MLKCVFLVKENSVQLLPFQLVQGVKLSYKSYKILYFWNCPIKSYIFSKCPINPIFSTKTAIFVKSFKHFQGMGRNKVRLVNKNNMKLYYYLQRSSKTWYLRSICPLAIEDHIKKIKTIYSYLNFCKLIDEQDIFSHICHLFYHICPIFWGKCPIFVLYFGENVLYLSYILGKNVL